VRAEVLLLHLDDPRKESPVAFPLIPVLGGVGLLAFLFLGGKKTSATPVLIEPISTIPPAPPPPPPPPPAQPADVILAKPPPGPPLISGDVAENRGLEAGRAQRALDDASGEYPTFDVNRTPPGYAPSPSDPVLRGRYYTGYTTGYWGGGGSTNISGLASGRVAFWRNRR
jgi:hypothetical protein